MPTAARHEIRALLRAHLSAATGYRHFTRHCPVCARLLRLAMEPRGRAAGAPGGDSADRPPARPATEPSGASGTAYAPPPEAPEDESPPAR
ncbi:DUF6274 family protein [Streptomyces sp. NPDC007100]|uniref:DUF6274 family protein n=1 Tax=Streptomyces sp. NPDC007100 TaxID=3155602 RepID=UPI0033F832B2